MSSDARYYQQLLIVLVNKFSPGKPLRLTTDDFTSVSAAFPKPDVPHLFVHGQLTDAIELSVIGSERAKAINDFKELQIKAGAQTQ